MASSVSSTESASASAAASPAPASPAPAPASLKPVAEKPKRKASPGAGAKPVPVNWPYEQADWEDADIRYEMNVPEPCDHGEKCWNKGKNGNGCAFIHPREAGTGYIYFPEREVDGVKQKECVRIVGSSLYYERRRLKKSWTDFVAMKRLDGAERPERPERPARPSGAGRPERSGPAGYASPAPTPARLSDFLPSERVAPGAPGPKYPAAAAGMPRTMLKEIMRELLFEEAASTPAPAPRPALGPRSVAAGGGGERSGAHVGGGSGGSGKGKRGGKQ